MDLSYVKTLDVDMPEELVRLKYAGMFKDFEKRAAYHLSRPELPDALKKRIELELHNAKLIEREYTLTEKELVEGLAKYAPGFTAADLDKIADSLDYVIIEGEKRYVSFSVRALFKSHPVMMNWPGSTHSKDDRTFLEGVIARMKEKGGLAVDIDITTGMEIDEKTAKGADLKVHVPFPTEKAFGMKNVRFIESEGECQVAPDTALQRTACFTAKGDERRRFTLRTGGTYEVKYMSFDEMKKLHDEAVARGEKLPEFSVPGPDTKDGVWESDLSEKAPQIVFTPFIKALSEKIVGDETDKLLIAKKIYDFMVKNFRYSYVRDYASIENLGEYFALRGRGDCGLQALLFIVLARYNGIPARWQSGITTEPEGAGSHDWAAAYFVGVGWRPVDPSYGGGEVRNGTDDNADFYFGNTDPYRWIFNVDIQEEFTSPKSQYRCDPYDNQIGEAETADRQITYADIDFIRKFNVREEREI